MLQRKARRYPKVRTGCTTCKARRVKCDEAKPQCRNCTAVGRNCGGYDLPKTLDLDVFIGEERRSYQYFIEQVGPRVAGLYGIPFWINLLPQFTYIQPAVKHAVVSVGALYEALQYEAFQGFVAAKKARAKQLRLFSLDQSNKALAILTKKMLHLPMEAVLATCLVFVGICNLLGDWKALFSHLMSGWRIATQWSNGSSRVASTSTERSVVQFLVRIGIQYGLPERRHQFPTVFIAHSFGSSAIPKFEIPESFPDLSVAYVSINHLMRHTEHLYGSQGQDIGHSPTAHVDLIPGLMSMLEKWCFSFRSLVVSLPKGFRPRQEHAVAQLAMQFTLSKLFILTAPFDNEMIFDRYTQDFTAIVKWAQRYVAAQKIFDTINDNFGHDWSINIPLRAVAAHCRDPKLRREAIRLLRESCRVGSICNNNYTADWMERLITIEEAGLSRDEIRAGIPEAQRLRFLRLRMYSDNFDVDGEETRLMPERKHDKEIGISTHIVTFSKWPYSENEFNLRHEVFKPVNPFMQVMRGLELLPSGTPRPFVDRPVRHQLPCGCTSDLFSVVGPGLQLFDDPGRDT